MTSAENKFINYRKISLVCMCFLILTSIKASSNLWSEDPDDNICYGYWSLLPEVEKQLDQQELQMHFENSKINFLNQSIDGENLTAIGAGIQITSDQVSINTKDDTTFYLKGNTELSTQFINIRTQGAIFDKTNLSGQANNVEFVIFPWQIHGTAKSASFISHSFILEDVEYSQCPPNMQDWSMSTSKIAWDNDKEYLTIINPTLKIKGYKTLALPSIDFTENHGTKKIIALPYIKLSTRRGLSLRLPYLKNLNESSLSFTPELSTQHGLSSLIEYSSDQQNVRVFSEIYSKEKNWDKYIGINNSFKVDQSQVFFDYSINFVSNDTIINRYKDIIPHYKKRIIPNFISIKQKTKSGYLQFFSEKNTSLEEDKLLDHNTIETPLKVRYFHQEKLFNFWQDFSLIHQDKEEDFSRYKFKFEIFPTEPCKIKATGISDNQKDNLFKINLSTPIKTVYKVNSTTLLSAHITRSLSSGQINEIETKFLPVTFSSILCDNWHNGDDWTTHFSHLLLHHKIHNIFGAEVELAARFNLGTTKISNTNYQYQSVFANPQDRLSALGIRFDSRQGLEINSLISKDFQKIISCEIERHFRREVVEGFATIFIHNYFPCRDKVTTKKVRQMQLGFSTLYNAPVEFFFHTGFDISPTKFNSLQAGMEYDRCCWKQIFGLNVSKKYSAREQKRVFEYGVSYKIDLYGLGFMRLGSDKNLKLKSISKKEITAPKYYKRFGG